MRHPDLVLYNATVRTVDLAGPLASLVAVREGRISFVGEATELAHVRGTGSRLVDCQGGCLIPGFHDAHLHLLGLASRLTAVDCSPKAVGSLTELREALAQHGAQAPRGRWLRGWGYDDWALAEGRHPNRWDLDQAAPHHPVRLIHRSGHAVVLNSLALREVGVNRETADPPGGVIERDTDGEPTGLLLEMSAYLEGRAPPMGEEELEEGLRRADGWLLSQGVTTVQDATASNSLPRWELLQRLKGRGLLTPRVAFLPGIAALESFVERGLRYGCGDEALWVGPAKIMLTVTTGALAPSPEELLELVERAHGLGFPVAVHAVEAEAVAAAAQAIMAAGDRGVLRDRIEHASELPPEVLKLVVSSGATVVTNPGFLYFSGDRYRHQIAPELQPWLYRIGSLQRRGVPVAFGSDAPVELPDPGAELYAAVTRLSSGGVSLSSGEGIGVGEALEAHTRGGAYAAGAEGWLGGIRVGMAADLVLLDRDPLGVEAEALRELRVRMTVAGGEVVWEG